ncbi:unnamed protein product [Paramecium octaurelia]|uniref:C2H2-type domain-containing protein n=1 Tax=Paramecium octaurelia TaxID=43137 RepID=A0A8S1W362_PAROT|nr:unnamed protein product [Paramecium octaurelia]
MSRKQHFIERDDMEEYSDISYRGYQFTPKKGFEMALICGSYKNLHSSSRQQRSNFSRQSQQFYNNSSKQTKANNQVQAFDEVLQQKDYSSKKQKPMPHFGSFSQAQPQESFCKEDEDEKLFYNQLGNIQQQMIHLDQIIEKMEQKMQDIKIQQLNFLNNKNNVLEVEQEGSDRQQYRQSNNNGSQWKVFSLKKEIQNDQIVELGKADDFEKYQIVYIQQNINGLVGRLSDLLQNQSQQRLSFRNSENDEGVESCFSFNRNSNRFVKIYKCKFCSQKFQKACSLGGHISRSHKEESQQSKKEAQPIKKTSIQKQKKASLQKSIGMQLMRL